MNTTSALASTGHGDLTVERAPKRGAIVAVTAAFFLMLREGLEAALIVGIIAAYLVKVGRRDALPKVWFGVGAAIAISVAAGLLVATTVGALPLVIQESIEGTAALLAVGVLTWMLFWMRRQGRAIKGDLERGVDQALAVGSTTALASLAFIAVVREGLETVLFLFAIGSATSDSVGPLLIASLAGLAVAVAIGWAIFAMGVRIDLRRFFTITGVILIFVSAGLVAFAIGEFTEAGLLPATPTVFTVTVLPETSPLGSLLAGLFGYRAAPTVLELIGYFAYLIPVMILFVGGGRRTRTAATASATLALAVLLAGCSSTGSGASAAPAGSGTAPVGDGETVEVAASEYKFDPSTITVPAGTVNFHVTNAGSEEHEFEIFKGDQVVDEVEGLVPGLDRTLTVDLEAGDYTFVCKLPGHEEAGMKGTLTVTGG
jgi:high-affinity iron transporter